jgi:PD-(D/E)XK nuclease superfamily
MATTKGKSKKGRIRATMIRNSERQSYKRCNQQWAWNFGILTGTPIKPDEEAKALRFGDLVHQALAAYYKPGVKRGPHPTKTFLRLYEEQWEELGRMNMRADDEDKWTDAGEMGEEILNAYIEEYGERDKQFKVLASEQTFELLVKVPVSAMPDELVQFFPTGYKFYVVGTTDGVWQDRSSGDIFFAEHKTAKAIDLAGLPMDEQAGTYWTFAPKWMWKHGLLPDGVYPTHILYNFLRKAIPDKRPQNEFGQYLNLDGKVSAKQPPPYFARQPIYRDEGDRESVHQRWIDEALEMDLKRRRILPVTKNPGPLYMPNCRGCPFRDPCELDETGAIDGSEAMIAALYKEWNPYDAHEKIERH